MTEATAIPSPNRETQRMLRHRSAVMTLARMRAKKSVLLELRAQGLKPQDFSAREIGVLTDYYVNQGACSNADDAEANSRQEEEHEIPGIAPRAWNMRAPR